MNHILSLAALFCSFAVLAQEDGVWRPVSRESTAYHEQRIKLTIPPYGLAKIRGLIANIEVDDRDNEALSPALYNTLSLREKFTYHMIHAESYSPGRDTMPPLQDEHKRIFAAIPEALEDYDWSDRQSTFLKANRDSVMVLLKASIKRSKRAGINFKHAIIEINGWEMIPLLIDTYINSAKKDLDILTLLMQLMRYNEYPPFLRSPSYRKLYSEELRYMPFLEYNKGNEVLIIKRATGFYNTMATRHVKYVVSF